MNFEIYNDTGTIGRAADYSDLPPTQRPESPAEPVVYLELLGCSIQEAKGTQNKGGLDSYSYAVYVPMQDEDGLGRVRFNGVIMSMSEYLSLAGRVDIKEGDYFSGVVHGKHVNGRISFYIPNQIGCKFGIIDTDK